MPPIGHHTKERHTSTQGDQWITGCRWGDHRCLPHLLATEEQLWNHSESSRLRADFHSFSHGIFPQPKNCRHARGSADSCAPCTRVRPWSWHTRPEIRCSSACPTKNGFAVLQAALRSSWADGHDGGAVAIHQLCYSVSLNYGTFCFGTWHDMTWIIDHITLPESIGKLQQSTNLRTSAMGEFRVRTTSNHHFRNLLGFGPFCSKSHCPSHVLGAWALATAPPPVGSQDCRNGCDLTSIPAVGSKGWRLGVLRWQKKMAEKETSWNSACLRLAIGKGLLIGSIVPCQSTGFDSMAHVRQG